MDKDVIYVVSSDDEDAPPKKQTKLDERSNLSSITNLKGMTVKKVTNSPEKRTIPTFKSDFDLSNTRPSPISSSNSRAIDLTENSPKKKATIDLTGISADPPQKKLKVSTSEVSIVPIKTSTSGKPNNNSTVPVSIFKSTSSTSSLSSALMHKTPANDQAQMQSKSNLMRTSISAPSTSSHPSTSKKPSPENNLTPTQCKSASMHSSSSIPSTSSHLSASKKPSPTQPNPNSLKSQSSTPSTSSHRSPAPSTSSHRSPVPSTSSHRSPVPSTSFSSPPSQPSNKNSTPVSILKVQSLAKQPKRIVPTTLSKSVSIRLNSLDKSSDSEAASNDEGENLLGNGRSAQPTNNDNGDSPDANRRKADETPKTPLTEEFKHLIEVCGQADKGPDMQQLIDRKLMKYYQSVNPKFVKSKSFRKTVSETARSIEAKPNLVYVTISGLVEELKTRRDSSKIMVVDNPDPDPNESITGDKKKDLIIRRLSKALHILKKKIKRLEEAEVDFDEEENSNYLKAERYKKRACKIYEKICDLTGESKDAQRLVKKPIQFRDSKYSEFNSMLETFVNKTKSFPDMFDVMRCLENCNTKYNYRLNKVQIENEAKLTFVAIGKLLQKRRKSDLYEMVSYYLQDHKDPALEDQMLKVKLEENQKQHVRKMREVIDKYAYHQEIANTKDDDPSQDPVPSTSKSLNVTAETNDTNDTSTSDRLNESAITVSSGNKSFVEDLFDDDDMLDVTEFKPAINLDDDMDLPMEIPIEIANVMSIDDFSNFGDSQVDHL